ncbi:MAG: ATP-dependent DNA helicase UvrD2 [Chloroflexota bacterium]
MPSLDPDLLLADLDPEQREAVLATDGPVAILAGAGSGKTRVISRRTAYAIATDVVPVDQVLVVTFTDKAAGEMVARLRSLGLPGVTARTFHAHALSQLRHFWPLRHDGEPLPDLLDSKALFVSRLVRQLPGHYRFTPSKDLADEIEWAKTRRIAPADYELAAVDAGRTPPIPADLVTRVYAGYERTKAREGRIDFEDLLLRTVDLLAEDEDAAETIRARKRWFSVDEYQDTNPLQQRLLELWIGDRRDLCVVGDEDQTIYSFTGASSAYLTGFERRWPGARVIPLVRNYRSTPQVLELANRLLAADGRNKRLVATRPDGPRPVRLTSRDGEEELDLLVAWVRGRLAEDVDPAEIAVLCRTNAALAPIEEAFTRAGIAYQLRGTRFYDRPEVRGAIAGLRRAPRPAGQGSALGASIRSRWAEALGWEEDATPDGQEARERQASLDTLVAIVDHLLDGDVSAGLDEVLADLDSRAAHEKSSSAGGVNLLTYHRAKGLEWDAVFLPSVDEGTLPIRQAKDDPDAIAEERRLLYVGITRARTFLAVSSTKKPSRFLKGLAPVPPTVAGPGGPPRGGSSGPGGPGGSGGLGAGGGPVFEALRSWRTSVARESKAPPYIIATDETLAAIAAALPRSVEELDRVKGIGPAKSAKYGARILAIVAEHRPAG